MHIKERECVCVCVWCCPCHWKCWGVQRGYFWISDSVSMAADASQRKALRYQQTLVGPNLLPVFYSPSYASSPPSNLAIALPHSSVVAPSLHLSLGLKQPLAFAAAADILHIRHRFLCSSGFLSDFFPRRDAALACAALVSDSQPFAAFTPPTCTREGAKCKVIPVMFSD